MATILIKNALIFDGTGKDGFQGDLLIENDLIKDIGPSLANTADQIIDAKGLALSPGFIDTHSHSDLKILENPYNKAKIEQGITTELLGQDGISMAPLPEQYISAWRKNLSGLDGVSDSIDWHYHTTDNYLSMMTSRGVGLNQAYLVPHGNIRMEVMGLEDRPATDKELAEMQKITRREMEAGAYGLSTGLIYIPCAYSDTRELIELCKVSAEFGGPFVVHQRSEADTIIDSMKEIIEVGQKSGVKIHYSHFKICGKKNWRYFDEVEALLDQTQAQGIAVSFDQYPYVAGSTMLGVALPPWAHSGGTEKLLERLKNPQDRVKMEHDITHGIPGWDNFIDFAGYEGIFVTSAVTANNQDAIGKSLEELGKMRHKKPFDAMCDLLLEEENAVGMVDFYGKEEHVIRFLKRKEHNACTDGLLGGKPHPRVFGAFPRILGKYVREEKVLTLPEAIRKMTGKPAEVFGFEKRGLLKKGFFADLVLFDPAVISDKGTFEEPQQSPVGIHWVFVNGQAVLHEGTMTNVKAGRVLRKGRI